MNQIQNFPCPGCGDTALLRIDNLEMEPDALDSMGAEIPMRSSVSFTFDCGRCGTSGRITMPEWSLELVRQGVQDPVTGDVFTHTVWRLREIIRTRVAAGRGIPLAQWE